MVRRDLQDLLREQRRRKPVFACKKAGFFAMSLMLAAKNLGLDTHPMDGFDHDGVKKAFDIPDNYCNYRVQPLYFLREAKGDRE